MQSVVATKAIAGMQAGIKVFPNRLEKLPIEHKHDLLYWFAVVQLSEISDSCTNKNNEGWGEICYAWT